MFSKRSRDASQVGSDDCVSHTNIHTQPKRARTTFDFLASLRRDIQQQQQQQQQHQSTSTDAAHNDETNEPAMSSVQQLQQQCNLHADRKIVQFESEYREEAVETLVTYFSDQLSFPRMSALIRDGTAVGVTSLYLFLDKHIVFRDIMKECIPPLQKILNARFGIGMQVKWHQHAGIDDAKNDESSGGGGGGGGDSDILARFGSLQCVWTAALPPSRHPCANRAQRDAILTKYKWCSLSNDDVERMIPRSPRVTRLPPLKRKTTRVEVANPTERMNLQQRGFESFNIRSSIDVGGDRVREQRAVRVLADADERLHELRAEFERTRPYATQRGGANPQVGDRTPSDRHIACGQNVNQQLAYIRTLHDEMQLRVETLPLVCCNSCEQMGAAATPNYRRAKHMLSCVHHVSQM